MSRVSVTKPPVPRVLFIDDLEGVSRAAVEVSFRDESVETKLLHPETVEAEDLAWADLVVVDYFLNDWPERDDVLSVSRAPRDGLAIVASLRSSLLPERSEVETADPPSRPTAFAVWSTNVDYASFGISDQVLPHVFARENTLEWVFKRNDLLAPQGVQQVMELGSAIRAVGALSWGGVEAPESLRQLLNLNTKTSWCERAESDVLDCRPPIHELARPTVGMSVIRWMLHRILPYPCFLLDEVDLMARLRVEDLDQEGALNNALEPARYRGALSEFLGPRWWRAGVESWLWDETAGQPSDTRSLADVAERLGAVPRPGSQTMVRVVDPGLGRSDELTDLSGVVRIRPDDWPTYADDAYATVESVVSDPSLFRLVDPDDRYLLQSPR